jgi:hypothetical protein
MIKLGLLLGVVWAAVIQLSRFGSTATESLVLRPSYPDVDRRLVLL